MRDIPYYDPLERLERKHKKWTDEDSYRYYYNKLGDDLPKFQNFLQAYEETWMAYSYKNDIQITSKEGKQAFRVMPCCVLVLISLILYLIGVQKYWLILGLLPLAKLNLTKIDGIKGKVLINEDLDVVYLIKRKLREVDPMLID